MEQKLSDFEDRLGKWIMKRKKKVKSKIIQEWNIQELPDTTMIKLKVMGTEGGENPVQRQENTLNKIIEEKFPN